MTPLPPAPITNNHSPITTPPIFISQDPELNASIARYFKYVHNTNITTYQLPIPNHQSPFYQSTTHHSPIIIFNEMLIDSDICSLYPLWFAFGLRQHIQVYAFTLGSTDFSCNLINWEDFMQLNWQGRFSTDIDFGKVPYFDNTRGHLTGILKPHGGESLYDLAAGFHMTFANASQYIARKKTSGKQVPANFKPDVIDPGIARFKEFQQKEPRHHAFLSMLPEVDPLFVAVKELESLLDELEGTVIQGTESLETLSRLLPLIQTQTSSIYSFFLNLEKFLQGGVQ
ncbi:MAG: hypothetical protein NT166_03765 [Candidatus Aminicenantes bacterium]|nr:hypothetical protein [Candidatus Aminicenantes bacterium]